ALDALLAPPGDEPAQEIDTAAAATLVRAMLLRDPAHGRLDFWNEAIARASPEHRSDADLARAWVALARGDLVGADRIIESVVAPPPGEADAFCALALLRGARHLVGGEYPAAERATQEALEAARAAGADSNDPWLAITVIVARLFIGDRAGATT